jgi:hypothetical protein
MYAIDFEFDGKRLSDFGCILTTFDGLRNNAVSSGASIVFSTEKPLGSDRYNIHSSRYDSPFSAEFCICKNPCDEMNSDNIVFSPREVSAIQRWLCRNDEYCKFRLLEDGYEGIYWNGYFNSQQHMLGSSIVGFDLIFTADSPYAYLDDIKLHYDNAANTSFLVDSKSDKEGYIYPNIILSLKSSGNFSLTNDRDNKIVRINNCTSGEIITMSGDQLLISSSNSNHDLSADFNYSFPRIINTYDNTKNIFTTNLACEITISYSPIIRVGF